MLEIIVFLYGLVIGSFLNVVIVRFDELKTIIGVRSHCPHCKQQLAWYDMVPVLSFALLRARCRYCRAPISWQYPLVELATGLTLVAIFRWARDQSLSSEWQVAQMIFYGLVVGALIVIFVYDLYHYVIPDEIVWPALMGILGYKAVEIGLTAADPDVGWQRLLLGGIVGAGIPALLVLPSRGKWMGYGDIKLGGVIGLLLGWPTVVFGWFAAIVLGGIIGLGLLMTGRKKLTSALPFGPFLVTGAIIGLLWGDAIIRWYLSLWTINY